MEQTIVIKTPAMQQMEALRGPLDVLLRDMYVTREMTQAAIAEELGVEQTTVSDWLRRLGIPVRHFGRKRKALA